MHINCSAAIEQNKGLGAVCQLSNRSCLRKKQNSKIYKSVLCNFHFSHYKHMEKTINFFAEAMTEILPTTVWYIFHENSL